MTSSIEFDVAWSGLTLRGTLHLPDGPGPHPAVMMMQGSGPADRDSGGYFTPIRDTFLVRGLATYAFDKPGCGTSTGSWYDYALFGRAEQAATTVEALRRHDAIDPSRVGVWGHSQGGWLAQMLAARLPDLAFAVANSGPSITVADQMLHDSEQSLRARGLTADQVEEALRFLSDMHDAARAGDDFAAIETRLDVAVGFGGDLRWRDLFPLASEAEWEQVRLFVTERYEPTEALRQVRCPFLAVYGGGDVLVPAWRCAEESGRALADAPCTDATVVVFPDGNHRMRRGDSEEFVDGYLDLLGSWVAARTRTSPDRLR